MATAKVKSASPKREYIDPSSPTAEEVGRYIRAVAQSFLYDSEGKADTSRYSNRTLQDGIVYGLASNAILFSLVRADARTQAKIQKEVLPSKEGPGD